MGETTGDTAVDTMSAEELRAAYIVMRALSDEDRAHALLQEALIWLGSPGYKLAVRAIKIFRKAYGLCSPHSSLQDMYGVPDDGNIPGHASNSIAAELRHAISESPIRLTFLAELAHKAGMISSERREVLLDCIESVDAIGCVDLERDAVRLFP